VKQKPFRHSPCLTRFGPINRKADNSTNANGCSITLAQSAFKIFKQPKLWRLKVSQLSLRWGFQDPRAITGQSTALHSRQNHHSSGKDKVFRPFENSGSPALHPSHI